MTTKWELIKDPIHGSIELHPLLYKIIRTPAFHRLKYIRQLGGLYYVYPGATHTRFEHSIGVSHLAGEFARLLQRKQGELDIQKHEILSLEVAGLCHDLGHGPFSHLFDGKILNQIIDGKKLKHEKLSTMILEHVIYETLKDDFKEHGVKIEVVKDMIDPNYEKLIRRQETTAPFRRFLYEIVANKDTGIDVDKWDYFVRDCHSIGMLHEFDWKRLMQLSRVIKCGDGLKICYNLKEANNILGMFRTRCSLYQKAYRHKTVIAVEHRLASAILDMKDEKLIYLTTSDSQDEHEPLSLKEILGNLSAEPPNLEGYLALTDGIIHVIKNKVPGRCRDEKKVKRAQESLELLSKRDLFHLVNPDDVSKAVSVPGDKKSLRAFFQELLKKVDKKLGVIKWSDICEENPIEKIAFEMWSMWSLLEDESLPRVMLEKVTDLDARLKMANAEFKPDDEEVNCSKFIQDELKQNELLVTLLAMTIEYATTSDIQGILFCEEVKFSYGSEVGFNPLKGIYFYRKDSQNKATKMEESDVTSLMRPHKFGEKNIWVYSGLKKEKDEKKDEKIINAMKKLYGRMGYIGRPCFFCGYC